MIISRSFSNLQDELSNKAYRLIPEVNKLIISAIEEQTTYINIPIDQLTTDDNDVEFIKEKLIEADYIIDDGCLGVIFANAPKKLKSHDLDIFCPFFELKGDKLIPAKYVLASNKTDSDFIELLANTFFEIFNRKLDLSIEKFHENPNNSYNFEICISYVFADFLRYKSETSIVEKFIKAFKKINTNDNASLADFLKLVHPLLVIKIKKQFEFLEYPFSGQIKPDQFKFNFTLNSSNILRFDSNED